MTLTAPMRAGLITSFLSMGACIALPQPLRERLTEPEDDGGGGEAGSGGSGGSEPGRDITPPCQAETSEGCSPVVSLAAGDWHTCALVQDGHVWCWGSNLHGELGDPSLPPLSYYPPQRVPNLENVEALEALSNATCALVGGAVYCWGSNELGELGIGTTAPASGVQRVALPGGAEVAKLGAAATTMCAIVDGREVWCWGRVLNGQEWWGLQNDPTPKPVPGFSDMPTLQRVVVGTYVGCGVSAEGLDVRCWGGIDDVVPVGDGTIANVQAATPVSDSLVKPITSISARGFLCTTAEEQIQCWGDLSEYDGGVFTEPTTLVGIDGRVVTQAQGWRHLCLLRTNGDVDCRGYGVYGELGPQSTPFHTYDPITVISDTEHLAVGWQHNCVILASGGVRCWGNNDKGQCNPANPERTVREPEAVMFSP